MRYAELRDTLEDALHEADLFFHDVERVETIDLATTVRSWKAFISTAVPHGTEPFHISAEISFQWTPFDAARAYTCEEDLLAELLGRRNRPTRTERRWTRIDLSLHASLPYGSTTPMPDPNVFGAWAASVEEKADAAFTALQEKKGQVVAILGGHGEVDVQAHCKSDGAVSLKGLAISGFRMVRIPRVWDDPDRREAETHPRNELDRLAQRFRATLDQWAESVAQLATWIRYSPPTAGAKPVQPWFEDESEDGDGGETIN